MYIKCKQINIYTCKFLSCMYLVITFFYRYHFDNCYMRQTSDVRRLALYATQEKGNFHSCRAGKCTVFLGSDRTKRIGSQADEKSFPKFRVFKLFSWKLVELHLDWVAFWRRSNFFVILRKCCKLRNAGWTFRLLNLEHTSEKLKDNRNSSLR